MKTDFKFSNLLGTVYCQGNLLFSPDGTHLYSPVGNRVTVFNLVDNKSYTLPFAHRKNISQLGLTPRGNLLLSIDEDGQAILTNLPRRIVLYHFSFRGPCTALAFAPSGRFFAVGLGRKSEVWHVPSTPDTNDNGEIEYAPFVRYRSQAGHYDTVEHIEWSGDSRFFLTCSKDLSTRIWSLEREDNFRPTVLTGHRQAVVGAWFSQDQEIVYTVSKDGALFEWQYRKPPRTRDDDESDDSTDDNDDDDTAQMRWRIVQKHYFHQNNTSLRCAAYHAASNLLVAGFSNGIFCLYEMPDFNLIHSLSIAQSDIDHVTINSSGEWLAFGASRLGQLLVWEWQSESYILKQQGHFDALNALAYAPDGQRIVTAADDGRVKVWDVASGFCVVTFTEHTSGVTACEFARQGQVLFTASLDGSVRAWDLVRYRNFRTFTAPSRLSFSCLAVDPSGEVVAAGSVDSFDIHIWSVQTGQLLDRLSGHEGPVSALAFTPDGRMLVSGSWDRTARLWSVFSRTPTSEPLQLQADVLAVAVRPDAQQLAVATLDGQLTFWSITDAQQVAGVDGRRDVSGGRGIGDRRTAAHVAGTKSFSTLRYSTDGRCLLAAGRSKYICLYAVASGVLLRKYTVSVNLSLSGTQEFLNSSRLTEAGAADALDRQGELSDRDDRLDRSLPGASRGGDPSARRALPEVRVAGVAFSPTGSAFCAASTEGLLVYSLDAAPPFDPFDLTLAITPAATLAVLREDRDYLKALVMAFRLNDATLLQHVFLAVPPAAVPHVVVAVPAVYVARLLRFVAAQTEQSPHIEFCLLWIKALVDCHGPWLTANRATLDVELRVAARAVARLRDDIRRLADDNVYTVDYLLDQAQAQKASRAAAAAAATARAITDVSDAAPAVSSSAVPKKAEPETAVVEFYDGDDDDDEGWLGMDD